MVESGSVVVLKVASGSFCCSESCFYFVKRLSECGHVNCCIFDTYTHSVSSELDTWVFAPSPALAPQCAKPGIGCHPQATGSFMYKLGCRTGVLAFD